jgi:allantoicase repeat-containing protein
VSTHITAASGAAAWVDLAVRAAGGGVVAASDETFAEKENLVATADATHAPHTFGHKGQVYDGWETRRRRPTAEHPDPLDPAGDDWAVIRLGLPGIVHRVVVDTAFFDGNHPLSAEVDTRWIEGHPTPADGPWEPLCGTALQGNTAHTVEVEQPRADGCSTPRTGTTRRRRTCCSRARPPTWARATTTRSSPTPPGERADRRDLARRGRCAAERGRRRLGVAPGPARSGGVRRRPPRRGPAAGSMTASSTSSSPATP